MSDWPPYSRDDELERADELLNQADALLQRHRGSLDSPPRHSPTEQRDGQPQAAESGRAPGGEDDELPILTDVVDDFEFDEAWQPAIDARPLDFDASPSPSPAAAVSSAAMLSPQAFGSLTGVAPSLSPSTRGAAPHGHEREALAQQLVALDTQIAREVSAWVASELPQIVERELDQLAGRLQAEFQAHLRATLLPELSARIGALLDGADNESEKGPAGPSAG